MHEDAAAAMPGALQSACSACCSTLRTISARAGDSSLLASEAPPHIVASRDTYASASFTSCTAASCDGWQELVRRSTALLVRAVWRHSPLVVDGIAAADSSIAFLKCARALCPLERAEQRMLTIFIYFVPHFNQEVLTLRRHEGQGVQHVY